MNEKFDFLPLGSIVVVSGGIKKFVIVPSLFYMEDQSLNMAL